VTLAHGGVSDPASDNGEEYHRFEKGGVTFYCLNSNYTDRKQPQWLEGKLTAAAYDRDTSFMLVEMTKEATHFQVISRTGETMDPGVMPYQGRAPRPPLNEIVTKVPVNGM